MINRHKTFITYNPVNGQTPFTVWHKGSVVCFTQSQEEAREILKGLNAKLEKKYMRILNGK